MSKFTYIVLCVLSASLSNVYAAISEEEKTAFREVIRPIIDECSKEHGVSYDELKSAKQAGNADGIKPCFLGCIFKKLGVLNSQGLYDVDAGLSKLRKFIKNEEDYVKLEQVGKQCASVNDQAVTDGDAGCDRSQLLIACIIEHKAEIPL